MRFYFDIDESEFQDDYGVCFEETVKERVCTAIANEVWNCVSDPDGWYSGVKEHINTIMKSRQNEIIEAVIERVAEKIAKKKALMEFTPKVSELAAIDKDNVAYFEEMIDKAIAKRFSKLF